MLRPSSTSILGSTRAERRRNLRREKVRAFGQTARTVGLLGTGMALALVGLVLPWAMPIAYLAASFLVLALPLRWLSGHAPLTLLFCGEWLLAAAVSAVGIFRAAQRFEPLAPVRPEFARALLLLGCERAWVVHGADGIDEISTTGYTKVSECRTGSVRTFYLHPSDVGLPRVSPDALRGGNPEVNARIARTILGGARGPARDVVLFNAGAALFVSGVAASVGEGIAGAADAIDRGEAARTLEMMIKVTNSGKAGGA